MSLDMIKPGDKIEISHLHQNNDKVYKSSVFEIIDNHEIEIAMPTDGGKMILFQTGVACQFYFYTAKGVFTCETVVTGRYKKDNFYLLSVRLTSPLKKFQRREFFRMTCSVDFFYYKITPEVAKLETTEDLFEEITNPDYMEEKKLARTRDLSGSGMKFTSDEKLEANTHILAVMRLTNDKIDHTFYLVNEIIECVPVEKVRDKWIVRGKWIFKNIKDRDLIVRYVFEEDRMLRKKENG